MASSNPYQQPGAQPGQGPLPQAQPLAQGQPVQPAGLYPQQSQVFAQPPGYPPAQASGQARGYPQAQAFPQAQPLGVPQTGGLYPTSQAYPRAQPYGPAQAYPQAQPLGQPLPQAHGYPQAYPQPQGASVRPVPVAPGSTTLPQQAEAEQEEPEEELTEYAIRNAPPWLISAVVHMVGMIILAMWVIVNKLPEKRIEIESAYTEDEVFAEKIGDQLMYDSPFAGNDKDGTDEPILTPDNLPPVENPFAAPPKVLDIVPDGTTATSDIEGAPIGYALNGREIGSKKALLGAYGGNATTEAAVYRGLEWLARVQLKDGSWSLTGPYSDGAADDNPPAATAMALLAFQGAGETHQRGKFKKTVGSAWSWLLKEQDGDGCFFHEGPFHHRFYTQGQCTIALCEIYGMTKDARFKEPAERAIQYILRSQSSEGGWRYSPQADSDVSVTGWIVMALQSARMAGMDVPQDNLRRVDRFLDKVSVDNGTRYPYQKGKEATLAMTAEAILCRQYLGWPRNDNRMIEALDWITSPENLVNYKKNRNVYYWYYATQVCHHMEGEHWRRWNSVMRQAVPEQQVRAGREAGSWDPTRPTRDEWEAHGGRLYVTCLSIYMLEVYYRHLPIYSKIYTVLPSLTKREAERQGGAPAAETAPDSAAPEKETPAAAEPGKSLPGNGNVAPAKDQEGTKVPQQPKPDQNPAQP